MMAGPWEDYAPSSSAAASGPWDDYASSGQPTPKTMAPASTGTQDSSVLGRAVGGAIEPLAQMATGALAAPIAGLAGLGTAAGSALGMTNRKPGDVVRSVESGLTYAPRSVGGKAASQVISYPFEKLAELGQGAGGKTTDILSKIPALRGAPAAFAGTGIDTALQALPMLLGAKPGAAALERAPSLPPVAAAKSAVSSGLRGLAERSMKSALKPAASEGERIPDAVDTLLERKINVSPGGLEKLNAQIDTLNNAIAQRIQNSPAIIDKSAVASRLYDAMDTFAKQVDSKNDLASIERVWENFMNNPLFDGKGIPVKTAQAAKQGTYVQLRKKYGELGSAETEAQKALARGLKEEIAKAVPGVAKLNAEDSKLLQALPMVERRVIVSANKNPLGLGLLSLDPKHMALWMMDRSELFKSIIAHMLNAGSKKFAPGSSSVSPNTLRTLLGGMQGTQNLPSGP